MQQANKNLVLVFRHKVILPDELKPLINSISVQGTYGLVEYKSIDFEPNTPYLFNVSDKFDIRPLQNILDFDYVSDLNKLFQTPGIKIYKSSGFASVHSDMFVQGRVSNITSVDNPEQTYTETEVPFKNKLQALTICKWYILQVSKSRGVSNRAGQDISGVHLVHEEAIRGVVIKSKDYLFGVSMEADSLDIEFRFKPIPNDFNKSSFSKRMSFTIDDKQVLIIYDKIYESKNFTIKYKDEFFYGTFSEKPNSITPLDIPESYIAYKEKKFNDKYDKLSMFVYCGETLYHIRFAREYVGDEFYIKHKRFIYKGRFKNQLTIDEAEALIQDLP